MTICRRRNFSLSSPVTVVAQRQHHQAPNFDPQRKYPVLVSTYGGPHAQVVHNVWGRSTFLWHELWPEGIHHLPAGQSRVGGLPAMFSKRHCICASARKSYPIKRDGVQYLKSLSVCRHEPHRDLGMELRRHMTLHAMFEAI